MNRNIDKIGVSTLSIILSMVCFMPVAVGSDLTVTKTFTTGEALTAADLNTTFDEVETAVTDNDGRISSNESDIGNHEVRISDNETVLSGKVSTAGDTMTGTLTVPAVDVSGDITVNSVQYQTSRTHYISIPAEAFVSSLGAGVSTSWGNGGAYPLTAGIDALVAAVYLPDGATITSFTAYFVDNAPGDLSVQLERRINSANGFYPVDRVDSTGASGDSNQIDTLSSAALTQAVDNTLNNYFIRAYSGQWPGNSSLRINSLLMTYTVSEAP